ncbi:MAG: gluconate:H+ symporter [Chitinophagaceae bacterium]
MTIVIVLINIAILILLIAWAKFNPFVAFLIVSLLAGWWLGIPVEKLTASVKAGMGNIMGELVIIICLGAMLGKIVAESGAAQKISDVSIRLFGKKYFHWAMMFTGFVVGIPLFYNVGFVLLIPLIFSVVYRTGMPAVYTALPMLAALSVTHGFLPPHPAPSAITSQLNANTGTVLLYGIVIAIPAIIIAGPVFASTLKKMRTPPLQLFEPSLKSEASLPGTANSFISSLLPAMLLIILTALPYFMYFNENVRSHFSFWGDPVIVLLISVLFATVSLGIMQGLSIKKVMNFYGDAVKDIAVILLIVAGAGALKQVLVDSGVSNEIGQQLQGLSINPLVLGWLLAAAIRVCVGSATVAGLTAAGILAPIMNDSEINANLMVLSIGAGSLMFSHLNDSGFWLFKEYFNLSVKDTLRSWSVMETIVSLAGLAGVMILNSLIG